VRSVWLCSRDDAIGNVIVMFAAFGVWGAATAWPDLVVVAVMAAIFLTSSVEILRQAWAECRIERRQPQREPHNHVEAAGNSSRCSGA
jgi:Co/Zn/Cd efflux system component